MACNINACTVHYRRNVANMQENKEARGEEEHCFCRGDHAISISMSNMHSKEEYGIIKGGKCTHHH